MKPPTATPPARLIARLAVATLTLVGLALWMHTPATAAVRTLAVATAQTFVEVTTGQSHSCGLTTSGAAYCWGDNTYGQLGDNSNTNKNIPTLVSDPSGGAVQWRQIEAGYQLTCAITTANAAYCWGRNLGGDLGDGTTVDKNIPTLVSNPSGGAVQWSKINAGSGYTCAITTANAAYCWGGNGNGQLGDGTAADKNIPTLVSNPSGGPVQWSKIAAGSSHTCAITTANAAYCWGLNSYGQLGDSSNADKNIPTIVSNPSGGVFLWSEIAGGANHTCAIIDTYQAYCWGRNSNNQLGDGTTANRNIPTLVSNPSGGAVQWGQIAAGALHTCAITTAPSMAPSSVRAQSITNAAYCWGFNNNGQLGVGSYTAASMPTAVDGSLSFTRLSTGLYHTCGIASATTYCWGQNFSGQLGDGTALTRNRPTDPPPASDPVSTSGGSSNDSPAPPPPTPTRIPTPTLVPLRYAWTRGTDPASIVVTSNKGFARSVARATRDPVTGARTFRGWVRNATTGDTYGVDENGLLVWVSPTDTAMLSQIDWSRTAEMDVAPAAIDAIPMDTPAEGRLLWEANGSGTVYVVGADRQLHAIPDLRTLQANYVWANVIPVTTAQIKLLPVGQPVPATT